MARRKARRGRGEGGIEQLKSGSWRGEVRKTDPVTGEVVRTRKTFATKPELLDWLKGAEPVKPGTVGEWLARWLDLHKAEVSAGAYRTDSQVVKAHLEGSELAGLPLRDLSALHCRSFLASLSDLSQSERHKVGRTLRMVCHAACHSKLIPHSPMRGVKIQKPPKPKTHALTPEELAEVILAADDRGGPWPAFFRLAADGGLRPQEMAGLMLQDLDLERGTVRVERVVCRTSGRLKVPKSDSGRRTLRLSAPTLEALRGWLAARPDGRGEFLFPAKLGGHWQVRVLDRWGYEPVIRASGVRMTPYTLRHTMATLLLRGGIGVKVVSARLGHADVAMTLRTYAHVLPDDQERAAGIMAGFLAPQPQETPEGVRV